MAVEVHVVAESGFGAVVDGELRNVVFVSVTSNADAGHKLQVAVGDGPLVRGMKEVAVSFWSVGSILVGAAERVNDLGIGIINDGALRHIADRNVQRRDRNSIR